MRERTETPSRLGQTGKQHLHPERGTAEEPLPLLLLREVAKDAIGVRP